MFNLGSAYFALREKIRRSSQFGTFLYLAQSLKYSNFGEFRGRVMISARNAKACTGVALCCRIRNEARYLAEYVEYYLAAGVKHFFFYEKLSDDNFRGVLEPYIRSGVVTLFDSWPNVPVSPSAEQDCVLRCLGRFQWLGFMDADEFVVVKDGRSLDEFLCGYLDGPAVALNWYLYGSNGHVVRPQGPVIAEYTRRHSLPNRHVKCFIRPEMAANFRNSHSWYFRDMRCAVNELRRKVAGSFSIPPTAEMGVD